MKKIPMTARKSMVYAGRRVGEGTRFDARGESDARVLEAIGNAARAHIEPPPPVVVPEPLPARKTVAKRDQVAEVPAQAQAVEEAQAEKPKRHYRRRDMDAESGGNEA